ncbi:MAG: hypothetical protein IJX53_02215 [Clostridia bacterium]|nr:hypothetical protein [Clostridia bacterium]
MENKNENETFEYTYSAKEQEELKRIRAKYLPQEKDKMTQLRRLDASVTQKASTAALIVGILGALTMGIGMCCAMVWMGVWFVPGIVIGLAGIALIAAAYPVYQHVLRRERKRIAPQIIRLTDELMK